LNLGRIESYLDVDAGQTRWSSLLRPSRAAAGRWTNHARALLDGSLIHAERRFNVECTSIAKLKALKTAR
jgi:hypothetical protein